MPGARLPLSNAQLSELLLSINTMDRWQDDFYHAQKICNFHLDARSGAIGLCDGRTGKVPFLEFSPPAPGFRDAYQQSYWQDDPVKNASMVAAPRRFWTRDELLPAETWGADPYITEVCLPNGHADVCIARIPLDGDYHCFWSFSRSSDQPRFSRLELDFLDMLLPHVEQVLLRHTEMHRLGVFADIAQEQLLQSGRGLVVLDQEGAPVHLNRMAAKLIGDGSPLAVLDGKLRLQDARLAPRFEELVRRCSSAALSANIMAAGSVAVPRDGASPFVIGVMPFGRQQAQESWTGLGRVAVTLFDPARSHIDTRTSLREMYRLSDAEADICWRLANGESLEKMAVDTDTTRETLRSQLKRVFAKTGARRQSELVRLVLLGSAAWSHLP